MNARDDPAVWALHVEETDIDRLAQSQAGWSLRYDQLTGGPFASDIQLAQLPGVRLVLERTNRGVRQRGQLGAGGYGFAMALDLPGGAFFAGQRLAHDSIMMGRGEDLDLCTPAGCALIGVVVDGELLRPLWQHLYCKPLPHWLEKQVAVTAAPACATAVRELHVAALARVRTLPSLLNDAAAVLQLRDAVLLEWIEAIPSSVDALGVDSVAARRQLVDRACEAMLARRDEPLSLLALCRSVGASPRKLGYCFQEVLGISPAKYVRALRLNAARRALKLADDPRAGVQDIAARFGFWHFGQFSLDYKRQFGELPSATLHAARGGTARANVAASSGV